MERWRIWSWVGTDGYEGFGRFWPNENPRWFAVILHGIQSHSGWYLGTGDYFQQQGAVVLALDRRGSGLNDRSRGDVPSLESWISDVREEIARLKSEYQGLPVVVCGISWGGKLAVALSNQMGSEIDGLVLIAPGLFPKFKPSRFQQTLLPLVIRMGMGKKKVPIPLEDPSLFTSDPYWREVIAHDPLSLHQITLDFVSEAARLDQSLPNCPTLLLLAERDQIIDNQATSLWFKKCPTHSRELHFPGEHTLEFSQDAEAVRESIVTWIAQTWPEAQGG